ncbi:MAG: zinc ribbon domain-containing protein [Candidatus Neomarinimicrobiota bacterium]
MPTYDYKCKQCEHEFEYFQSMSDDVLKECPQCKGDIRRLISGGSGLIFKGSGFYSTDYAPKKPKKTEKTEKSDKTAKTGQKTETAKGKGNNETSK